jgi:hypothetical protein
MERKDKIRAIMLDLTGRYGKPELKDGQKADAVLNAWENALGGYSVANLKSAVMVWNTQSKFPRWPEPAELIDILKSMNCYQEKRYEDNRPENIKRAEADASFWYHGIVSRPSGHGFISNDMAVNDIIGAGLPDNVGKSFNVLLTTAWLNGVLPNHWERLSEEYFARMNERANLYQKAVKEHGPVAVHERMVKWLGQ